MDYYIFIYSSGNYAYKLLSEFEKKSKEFEVIATPCIIAKQGCGYSLKAPIEYYDEVMEKSAELNCPVREVYSCKKDDIKKKYDKVFPKKLI